MDEWGLEVSPTDVINTTFEVRNNSLKRYISLDERVEILDIKIDVEQGSILNLETIPKFLIGGRRKVFSVLREFESSELVPNIYKKAS